MIGESIEFTGYYSASVHKNTWTDWHLVTLTKLLVAPPPFKSNYVNVDGMTGELDLSDTNGLNYANRRGSWAFKLLPQYDFDTIRSEVIDFLHGGVFDVTISTDIDECYYHGRITVTDWKHTEQGGYITLSYNFEPFRYDPSTEVNRTINLTSNNKTSSISIQLTRMPVVPYIKVNSINGDLKIYYYRCTSNSTVAYRQAKTVNYAGIVDTSDMVMFLAPSGAGGSIQRSGVMEIEFEATTSANITFEYMGGRF